MRANVKPLTHWAIYKSYKMRITQRGDDEVSGIFTTSEGQLPFRYQAAELLIHLAGQRVQINEYGWEIGQSVIKSEK